MQPKLFLLALFISWASYGQFSLSSENLDYNSIKSIADSIASRNELHAAYVAFPKSTNGPYELFQQLSKSQDTLGILGLIEHRNAVVRGYAFWALAKLHYSKLDKLLIAHAKDEERIRYIQGRVLTELPLSEFMLWVVNPEIMDRNSKKLPGSVIKKMQALRYSN